jgi:hypothetical protein
MTGRAYDVAGADAIGGEPDAGWPLASATGAGRAGRAAKRAFDVAVAGAALLCLAPVLAGVAIAVRVALGTPVIFRHERPGLGGRPFTMYKFRTMREPRRGKTPTARMPIGSRRSGAVSEEPASTSCRSCGTCSAATCRSSARGRCSPATRPTSARASGCGSPSGPDHGAGAGAGRNHAPWDERLALDVEYVEGWSFWLDVRLLLETLVAVVRARDVAVDARAVMRNLDEERAPAAEATRP